ncbi:MAG: hypothetical protein NZ699_08285 [Roseiflexus sp.]|nr:hypothetical protein [Roseiflexus sp.]MCS7289114.1 hypothetical protein [Roseiflexus sp.]MDW8144714.1 hypothetical protein [Roseiflexaceae bacterium]MDW8233268.1 hypothetical protein [Roseiflexaceae bacterium]
MIWLFPGVLALIVVLGSAAIIVSGRLTRLPASVVAFVFAITAVSWVVLIVVSISLMMRSFATISL